ncbi:pseudouridine synthase [Peteryoungia desertarenae]|uniref:Pseudouridine synthase n=1 Tax=Peteryoungia desertarenae TaxID=1813451 RepID=A0ABX6QMJ3_9HYPH|nr:pseudouridine synthase [Peteryoungia desertarenae]QLF69526.1 pseudouridine synthase [Peteryoungia desertarenae]
MTFKDKSRRPAGKPAARSGKPISRKPKSSSESKPDRASRPAAVAADDAQKPERISKLLARAGIASRRDVERMIMDGRVALNGKVLDTPVVNATLNDKIEVDGQPIRGIERTRLWLYHKPAGLVTTNSDPEGRPTVFENLPDDLPRVMSIGRLDINTEGLLLLTNDGGLARVLELPTTGWLRRYRVRAHGEVEQADLDKLKEGIAVDGVLYGSIDATLDRKQGHNVWITMGLREGKNREIKNVLGALGLEVNRLIRISYGPFQLGDLPEGKVMEVRGRMLRDQLGPRLIEDAKANFDAPIYAGGGAVEEDADEPKAKAKPQKAEWGREEKPRASRAPRGGGKREDQRERALDRLDTRRDSGDRFADKSADKSKRAPAGAKNRTTNVWMAPGARPLGEKAAAAAARRKPDLRADKPVDRFDDRSTSTVKISRARDDEGEWIRAEGPDKKAGGRDDRRGGFGDRGPRRDSAERGDRGDRGARRDFAERSGRGPRRDGEDRGPRRDFGDRPTRGERSSGERSFGDKPRGAKPFGDKPRGGKPFGDKPAGKSFGGKPGGGKSFGGKPSGGKGFGGKPSGKPGGRPSSGGGRGPAKGKR